jgi:aryl-alcohol dehydrogenase-like predicted oxidoreductase
MGSDLDFKMDGRDMSGFRPLPVREYAQGVSLSIVGFGALALVGMPQGRADRLVADSVARGVNYFDVAPAYGGGEAEQKLGIALHEYRPQVFLACKTLARTGQAARLELERSLRNLKSDRLDLYQFHAVNRAEDLEGIFAPGGAMEAFLEARRQGMIRFIGFSSHSVPISLALLDRFRFDSILFPVNFVCYARGNFGPQVVGAARARGITCLALKSLAQSPWTRGEDRRYPNCWYRPVDDPTLARASLRFAWSEGVGAVLPPGDEGLYRMAVDLAVDATPLAEPERAWLFARARRYKPIFRFGRRQFPAALLPSGPGPESPA